MNPSTLPTKGQLERTLSQRVQALYRNQLEHQPSRVHCHISDGKVFLVLEDSITKPEQVLVESGKEELAGQVRDDLNQSLHSQLAELISELLGVQVLDILIDATLETGRTGTIVVLEDAPQFRDPQSNRRIREETAGTDNEQ